MPEHPTPDNSPVSPAIEDNAGAFPEQLASPERGPLLEESAPALDAPAPQENPALAPHAPEKVDAPQETGSQQSPAAPPDPATARLRGRRSLPDSPLERAKLEAQTGASLRNEASDRSTMVAFGLLFVVPLLIILLSLLLLLPFINSQLTEDPSGVDTQSISRGQTPTR